MIKSRLALNILDLALDQDSKKMELLRKQVPYLEEIECNYTKSGLFIYFRKSEEMENLLAPFEEDGIEMIDGILIENEEENILADAIVWVKSGFIDHIEIWNKIGDYPIEEPTKYKMSQVWMGSKGGNIIVV